MKELSPALFEIRDDLGETHTEVEVYHKRGRSRMLRVTPHGDVFNDRQEEGWAVRAGDNRRSLFYAAAGTPRSRTEWPEADGDALRLPLHNHLVYKILQITVLHLLFKICFFSYLTNVFILEVVHK